MWKYLTVPAKYHDLYFRAVLQMFEGHKNYYDDGNRKYEL